MRRRLRRNKRTLSPKQRAALAKGRRALAAKRAGHAKPKRRRTRRASKPRVFGGHFRAVGVRIGPKRRKSFAYLTKRRHKLRHIPDYAIMGYRSPKDAIKRGMTTRGAAAYIKRKDRLKERREKAAAKISARILAGKFPLTPNRRRRRRARVRHVVTFRNWEKQMLANRRKKKARKKSRTRRRRATPAQLRALARGRATQRRKRTRKHAKRRSYRRNPLMQAAANKRRRRHGRRRARRNPLMQAAANRRRRRRHRRNAPLMQAAANRRRRHRRRHARRNPLMQAAANRRRRHGRRHYSSNRRRHGRRVFRRNAVLSGLVDVLKQGGIAAVGLVGQKALTRFIASKIGTMLPASLAPYANSISALLVALPAVWAAGKVLPGSAKLLGVGVGAGAVHTIAVDVAKALGQQKAADFLGYGSYYQFSPGQQYSGLGGGYGEYFTSPVNGFGSFGAAGGGSSPQLTQAAAGEYIIAGAQGIGEYEQVTPEYSTPEHIREGISPDLDSAERALSIAEAAAGVGVYNGMGAADTVGLQSTVYPQGSADVIPDQPGGSRAGVFCGENGVFGPCG